MPVNGVTSYDELVVSGAGETTLEEDNLADAIELLPLIEEMDEAQIAEMLDYLTLFDDYNFELVDLRGVRSIVDNGIDPFDDTLSTVLFELERNSGADAVASLNLLETADLVNNRGQLQQISVC